MTPLVFMDTETLGLQIQAPIWEFAAIRREPDGAEESCHCYIDHDPSPWLGATSQLPPKFRNDYLERYLPQHAVTSHRAAEMIHAATRGAHIVGAVPSFDTERIAHLMERTGTGPPAWRHHLIDIENVVAGYLAGTGDVAGARPPYNSDELSKAIGVNPDDFWRHSAMGDVLWVRAQWDAIMGRP